VFEGFGSFHPYLHFEVGIFVPKQSNTSGTSWKISIFEASFEIRFFSPYPA